MANPYDKAHELGRAIKESNEYSEYIKIKKELYENSETKELLQDFKKKQYEVQILTLDGKSVEPEKMEKIQELYKILVENPKVKEYFDIEIRFNVLLADINKIIGESVKEAIME